MMELGNYSIVLCFGYGTSFGSAVKFDVDRLHWFLLLISAAVDEKVKIVESQKLSYGSFCKTSQCTVLIYDL